MRAKAGGFNLVLHSRGRGLEYRLGDGGEVRLDLGVPVDMAGEDVDVRIRVFGNK